MARSVYVPSGSVYVSYSAIDCNDDDGIDWDYYKGYFQREMRKAFPSLYADDGWVGDEGHILLSNKYVNIGVSEYCGLVAMWVQPKESDWDRPPGFEALRDQWVSKIGPKFENVAGSCFGQALVKQGVFSNGEAIFQPLSGQQKGEMSLGYSSKEGWL